MVKFNPKKFLNFIPEDGLKAGKVFDNVPGSGTGKLFNSNLDTVLKTNPLTIKTKTTWVNNIKKRSTLDRNAKKLGFQNESDFNHFFKHVDAKKMTQAETAKATKLYNELSKIVKKSKNSGGRTTSVAKLAIAGGTISAMVIYLQSYRNERSGCFRLFKNSASNDNIGSKFIGKMYYCGNASSEGKIRQRKHPLFAHEKWDCNYNDFINKNETLDKILKLGCNGLCNVDNFNFLVRHHTESGKFAPVETDLKQYKYECRDVSLLEALSQSTETAVSKITQGILDSELVKQILKLLLQIFVLLLLFFCSYKIIKYMFQFENGENKKKKEHV